MESVGIMAPKRQQRRGKGIFNKLIDSLPFEAHIPGYNYVGPGTKLQQRLSRGDAPVNGLDAAARDHDIMYSKTKDTKERNKADLVLADKAWDRVKAADSSLGERLAAYAVTNAMKLKAKLGMGSKAKKNQKQVGVKKSITKKKKERVIPRVIPLPRSGGNVKSVLKQMGVAPRSIGPASKKIESALAVKSKEVRVGKGLYLRPYSTGYGLYLRPWAPDLN